MAEFYDNMPNKVPEAMTPADRTVRKLARDRAYEIGHRNAQPTPTLLQTYFGSQFPSMATMPNMGKVSIQTERRIGKSLADRRVYELSRRRKIASSYERHKFF
jgi:hypothetical protein